MKLPYDYVAKQVDILFNKKFEKNQELEINQYCDFIIAYIEACGWSTDDFIEAMWQEYWNRHPKDQ